MLDGNEIRRRVPHRYPFLLLDRVLELEEGRAFGYKNVSANEAFFRGHFPEAPVMPGVLVIESLIQLVWVLFADSGAVRVRGIRRLKFRKPVVPGDRLELEVRVAASEGDERQVDAVARLDGKVAVEGRIIVELARTAAGSGAG
ncbi:MAG: 3-hydroxyacyl-ACP dehydratase FabZ [Armatimonadetes bacterium]|nr:3-hydroxyacyl-ACP dehydratase FabZ [Armatimonadota bacterium]